MYQQANGVYQAFYQLKEKQMVNKQLLYYCLKQDKTTAIRETQSIILCYNEKYYT